jgi:hypothetical protein
MTIGEVKMNHEINEIAKLKLLRNGEIVATRQSYGHIADVGDLGVVVDAPASMPLNHEGLKVLVTSRGYIVVDEAEVEPTGKSLAAASYEACEAARVSGLLQRAILYGKLAPAPDGSHLAWLKNLKAGDCVEVPYTSTGEGLQLMTVYENDGVWIRLLPDGLSSELDNTILVNALSGVLHYAPVLIAPPGTSAGKSHDVQNGYKPFTVLGNRQGTGKLIAWHVVARDGLHAFSVVAADHKCVEFSAAIPGYLSEADGTLTFPGSALVDAETVLEQPDVFSGAGVDHASASSSRI